MLVMNRLLHEVYHMRCYDALDEEIELLNRAIKLACPADAGLMEAYEEYCRMKQYQESEEYWLDAGTSELARQWDE